jgi:hypothetical protein
MGASILQQSAGPNYIAFDQFAESGLGGFDVPPESLRQLTQRAV